MAVEYAAMTSGLEDRFQNLHEIVKAAKANVPVPPGDLEKDSTAIADLVVGQTLCRGITYDLIVYSEPGHVPLYQSGVAPAVACQIEAGVEGWLVETRDGQIGYQANAQSEINFATPYVVESRIGEDSKVSKYAEFARGTNAKEQPRPSTASSRDSRQTVTLLGLETSGMVSKVVLPEPRYADNLAEEIR